MQYPFHSSVIHVLLPQLFSFGSLPLRMIHALNFLMSIILFYFTLPIALPGVFIIRGQYHGILAELAKWQEV